MVLFGIIKVITIISFVLHCVQTVNSAQSVKYKKHTDNAKFPISLVQLDKTSALECSVLCDREPECISVNHNTLEQRCELTDHYPQIVIGLTDGIGPNAVHLTMDPVPGWSIYYKENPSCAYGYTVHFTSEAIRVKTSTNYPSQYNDDENYFWLFIKPTAMSTLYLDFTVLDVEPDQSCSFDSITVYSGACTDAPILAKLCGTTPQTISDTSGIYVLLNFKSDPWTTGKGFYMNYYIGF